MFVVRLLTEVLKTLSRLSRDRVQLRLVVVFKIFSQVRVLLRFLELNTLMLLLGVHAEVEDLLEVLNTLSQDRAQQPEVELVIAGLLVVSSLA